MLNEALKKSIEKVLSVNDLNISFKNNPMASDGSFICLDKTTSYREAIKKKLLSLKWIEQVSFDDSYLNFWLIKKPLDINDVKVNPVNIKKPLRLYQLRNRLQEEIKSEIYIFDDHWLPLIKVYNLCVVEIITLEKISKSNMEALFATFKRLDLGFMYRKNSDVILSGILIILNACVALIDRTSFDI